VLLCMSPTSNPIFEMKAVCSFKVHSLPLVVTLHDESPVGIRDLGHALVGGRFVHCSENLGGLGREGRFRRANGLFGHA